VALEYLKGSFRGDPTVQVASYRFPLEPAARHEIRSLHIDTIVCCNVLEHIEDDRATLKDLCEVLEPRGRLVLLVPALARLFGTLDEHLHHFRRYEKPELIGKLVEAGFSVEDCRFVNKPGVFGWYVNGKLLRRRVLPRGQLRVFSLLMPLLRREEQTPPAYGMSLLAIARRA
jgi:SAM-dependent methyltransferase